MGRPASYPRPEWGLSLPTAEGELPLPLTDTETTAAGTTYADTGRAPDTLELSADGGTLTYSYRFDTALADQTGGEIHRAGVYRYTVDLAAGSCTQTIDPL